MHNKKKIIIPIIVTIIILLIININIISLNATNLLFKIFSQQGNNVQIEKLLKNNLYIQTFTIIKKPYLMILSAQKLIDFYNNQLLFNESEKIYEEYFIPISKFENKRTSVFYDNYNENLAKIYSDLGDIKLKLNKFKEAESYYKKAIAIKQEARNQNSFSDWIELNKLGRLKLQEGNIKEAAVFIEQAITKYKEKNNDISWKIIYNLSQLYKQKGEYKRAEQYAEYLLLNSPSLPDFVPIPDNDKFKTEYIIEISKLNSYFKQNLAEIYIEENKLEEALKLLKQSLIINNYIYGENSVYTLCNNYKLYNLYSIKNDNQQKEKEYLEINNIKSKILGTKDLKIEQLSEVCKI